MSRETQFVGLTQAAQDFVADLQALPSASSTTGMFDEEIPLRQWEMHPSFRIDLLPDREMCVREVVQEVPWSSGPMIFTRLELDWGNGATSSVFEWIHDPTVEGEVDYGLGRCWV